MRRLVVAALAAALVLGGCSGGDDEKADGPSIPLPSKAPDARGPATGPALEAKVLLASTDELEEQAGDLDTAQVDRRSGAFVSGKTVVGYSVDNISGYDLTSGEKTWTAKLDLEGGTVCFVSQPDRAVKRFTVVYGEGSYCPNVATIRVADGKVVKKSDRLSGLGVQFQGESAGGSVNHLFTIKGKDYLVDMRGVVWAARADGDPDPVAKLKADSYFGLLPTPTKDVLIGSRLGDRPTCQVDAYALPSFKPIWTQDNATLFPEAGKDCVISAAQGNPAWLSQQVGETEHIVQVDPKTGKVLGRTKGPQNKQGPTPAGTLDVASAALHFDTTLGLPGGDMVLAQSNGISRYSLAKKKMLWDLDLGQLELASDQEYPLTDVLPQGVTKDGYLVASVSNNTAAEVVAVDVKTGKLKARWPLPEEYRNGFQVQPGLTLFGDGVVLTRNFERWEFEFADYKDVKEPEGDRYDIGVFTFPQPTKVDPKAVPTVGPVDTEATALAGLKTTDTKADRDAGAFTTGSQVIAYGGNVIAGYSTKGKKLWSGTLGDASARVCAAPDPDKTVKTFTIAIRPAEGKPCSELVRYQASDGKELARASAPSQKQQFSSIRVHDGAVLVVDATGVVSGWSGTSLARKTKLRHPVYTWETTPEDPDLVVTTSRIGNGEDWAVDAYRLPDLAPAWSTTAKKVFGSVDPKNYVSSFRGNPLWLSTSYGDPSDEKVKPKDVLVQLDPASGKVVASTGKVTRDYLADDLKKFSLTQAVNAGYISVGFDDGSVVLPQSKGIVRYSLQDKKAVWTVDTSSIMASLERERGQAATPSPVFELVDGGKTVLVTLSNDTSVELMTLQASSGKITGRWKVPTKARNGLQTDPEVTPFKGGVALSHSDYSWDYAFGETATRKAPTDQRYDVGLFGLPR